MSRLSIDKPALIIFLAGVSLLVASTGLGLYLARSIPAHIERPDWHQGDYDSEVAKIGRIYQFLWDIDVLMWMTFTLGTILTLAGIRMLIRRVPGTAP